MMHSFLKACCFDWPFEQMVFICNTQYHSTICSQCSIDKCEHEMYHCSPVYCSYLIGHQGCSSYHRRCLKLSVWYLQHIWIHNNMCKSEYNLYIQQVYIQSSDQCGHVYISIKAMLRGQPFTYKWYITHK